MSISWIDVAGSTLPSLSEPIDFTASAEVIAISVRFGRSRIEERVYRDGAFLYPYLRSTRDGLTFRLVRDDGWPSHPRVFVDEVPPTGRAVLYEVNFTTLPNQTLVSGANVIDGKNWWLKGTPGADVFDIAGGLRFRSQVGPSGAGLDYSAGAIPFGVLYMPYSQLAGYDPARLTITQCWWQTYSLAYPGNLVAIMSSFSCAHSAAAVIDAERTGGNLFLYDQAGGSNPWRYKWSYPNSGGGAFVSTSHTFLTPANREVLSIVDVQAGRAQLAAVDRVATPGLWPAQELSHLSYMPLPRGSAASPSAGLAVWVQNNLGPAFGVHTFILGGFRVMQ